MRLCFLADPGSIHTRRWVGHFAKTGHQVHLINMGPNPQYRFDWPGPQHHNLPLAPVIPVPGARGAAMLATRWRSLRILVRQIEPDVMHAHYVSEPAWFAALSGFHPLVLTAWGSDILLGLNQGSRLSRWLTRYALGRADLFTADARHLLMAARPYLRPVAKTALVRFGVDMHAFYPGIDTTWRNRLGLGDAPLVVSIRQCHPLYNIDTIVQAWAVVRLALPRARLVIKLVHQRLDDPYPAELRQLVSHLRLDQAVIFVPQAADSDMPDLYRAADVVVSVPSSDGMPVSVLEAMACGTPVVASDLPALRELVDEGAVLALVPPRDAEALGGAILVLFSDSGRRQQMIEQNLATVRRTGDFAIEMARMEHLYQQVLVQGMERQQP
jgi:glycosyltransferase involved in cell wall biosynthesis